MMKVPPRNERRMHSGHVLATIYHLAITPELPPSSRPSPPPRPPSPFLAADIASMKVDDHEITGHNARVSVESLNEVPEKLRGVTHVFARQVPARTDPRRYSAGPGFGRARAKDPRHRANRPGDGP